jgi:hypothetical protein
LQEERVTIIRLPVSDNERTLENLAMPLLIGLDEYVAVHNTTYNLTTEKARNGAASNGIDYIIL